MENEKKYPIKFPEEMPFKEKRLFPGAIEGYDNCEFQNTDDKNINNAPENNQIWIN